MRGVVIGIVVVCIAAVAITVVLARSDGTEEGQPPPQEVQPPAPAAAPHVPSLPRPVLDLPKARQPTCTAVFQDYTGTRPLWPKSQMVLNDVTSPLWPKKRGRQQVQIANALAIRESRKLTGTGVIVTVVDGGQFDFWADSPAGQQPARMPSELVNEQSQIRIRAVGSPGFESMKAMTRNCAHSDCSTVYEGINHALHVTGTILNSTDKEHMGFAPSAAAIIMSFKDPHYRQYLKYSAPITHISNHSWGYILDLKWRITSRCEIMYTQKLFNNLEIAQKNRWPNIHTKILAVYHLYIREAHYFDNVASDNPGHTMVFASGNYSINADGYDRDNTRPKSIVVMANEQEDVEVGRINLENGGWTYTSDTGTEIEMFPFTSRHHATLWFQRNGIIVGNLKDIRISDYTEIMTEQVHTTSSCGPLLDGRITPTVVANGHTATSSWLSGSYNDWANWRIRQEKATGTSMASPAVSGVCALVSEKVKKVCNTSLRHKFDVFVDTDGFEKGMVRSCFLKALLVHTALPPTDHWVHPQLGYGVVDAQKAVDFMDDAVTVNTNPKKSHRNAVIVHHRFDRQNTKMTVSVRPKQMRMPVIITMCYTDKGEKNVRVPDYSKVVFTPAVQHAINPIVNEISIRALARKAHYPYFLDVVTEQNPSLRLYHDSTIRERNDMAVGSTQGQSYHAYDTVKKIVIGKDDLVETVVIEVSLDSSTDWDQSVIVLASNCTQA